MNTGLQTTRRKKLLYALRDYALITFGSVVVAVAIDVFMTPNKVVAAGATGVAMLVHFLFKAPVGLMTLALNIPLLLAGIRWGGGLRFFVRTGYAVLVLSLAIDLLDPYLPEVVGDPLVYVLFGGLLDGLGIGLVLKGRGTTGGTDILAQLLHRHRQIPFGQVFLWSNGLILAASIPVVGLKPALLAMVVTYISSQVLDAVQEGMGYARSVLIVSEKREKVHDAVDRQIGRGVTYLEAEGGYSRRPKPVLWVVVSRSQITPLKRIISEVDPDAFVVVTQAKEVLGQGFRPVTELG